MSDFTLDEFDFSLEEDPMGPFGTGPAVEDDDPLEESNLDEGFGEDGAYGPVNEPSLDDLLYEQFGDFDAFGPFRSRYEDYSSLDDGWPYPDLG